MRRFRQNLRRLHRALAPTPINDHYWIWAGLLLGWAREGDVLSHDIGDADFAYLQDDRERFLASIPALIAAGFLPLFKFRNHHGTVTQYTFARHGSFEFFELEPIGDRFHFYGYFGFDEDAPIEIKAEIPHQECVPFTFLGREWLKVRDHDLELQAMYGEWWVPQADWQTDRDLRAIVDRRPWLDGPPSWDGDLPDG